LELCIDTANNDRPTIRAICDGADCTREDNIPSGTFMAQLCDGTECERVTDAGVHTYSGPRRPYASIQWTAGGMVGDGSECDSDPTVETIDSVPAQGLRCPMAGSETDGFIYNTYSPVTIPGNFDKTEDAEFSIKAWLITDSGAGTHFGQISIACVGNGGTKTWGSQVALNITPAAADAVNSSEVHDTAAAVVDTDTTGSDCDPGDSLYWRWRSCDTDATPSTGCTSSAGFENDTTIFSMAMRYRKNSETE
jgi:hypothetical protein